MSTKSTSRPNTELRASSLSYDEVDLFRQVLPWMVLNQHIHIAVRGEIVADGRSEDPPPLRAEAAQSIGVVAQAIVHIAFRVAVSSVS